jgi:hypothetical protein
MADRPRLLKYLKRCGLIWIYARAIFTPLPFTQTAIAWHPYFSYDCLLRSTKNLFPAGFAGKNILSVSARLLKTF